MKKLLCYELNEVPWRVVDHYLAARPGSRLAALLDRSAQFTTQCPDRGELQPWSTWPTLHRGVSNEVHRIDFLNQDLGPAAQWPPVWEQLVKQGVSCGIFGSLQSYPPVQHENMRFHIPDTFAAGPETIPAKYADFQAFNLKQTGANKAIASGVDLADLGKAVGLLRSGIRLRTGARVVRHLIDERREALFKTRRALLQPELAFDVFMDCLDVEQPDFVTFFSNHVAGIMHRYWKYTFPDDFGELGGTSARDRFHADSLLVAMDVFDAQLERLESFAERNDYALLIVSSMGQEAIDRGEYIPELTLDSLDKLLDSLHIEEQVTMNLAMQPDLAFVFQNSDALDAVNRRLSSITDTAGQTLLEQRYASVGTTLNLALRTSSTLARDHTAVVDGEHVPLERLGLALLHRDQGTGYHQPEGILIWEGLDTALAPRADVDSRTVLPSVLRHYGVAVPDYAQPPIPERASVAA